MQPRMTMIALGLGLVLLGGSGCSPEVQRPPARSAAAGSALAAQAGSAATLAGGSGAPAVPHMPADNRAPTGWTDLQRGPRPAARPMPLVELLARPKEFQGQVVRTTGAVDANCPGGCWVLVGQRLPGGPLRVTFEGAELKTPPDAKGAILDVQGTLALSQMPLEKAVHFEEERAKQAGDVPRKFTEAPLEVTLQAVGWTLTRTPDQAQAAGPQELPPCLRHQQGDDLLGGPHP